MRTLKEIACWFLILTGLSWVAARLNRRKFLVLEYHDAYYGTLDPVLNFDGLHVRVDRFERQMRYLAARYCVVTLDQLLEGAPAAGAGKPLAVITIDDGYKNTYRYAYPVLRRLGLPATVFIIADFLQYARAPWWDRLRAMIAATRRPTVVIPLQGTQRWLRLATAQDKHAAVRQLSPELHRLPPERREALLARLVADLGVEERTLPTCEPLSVDELREMAEGGISVGSHGRSHDSFLHLSRENQLAELTESKRVLESVTGHPIHWLAYPYGEFSGEAIEAAIRAGYRGAVTTIEGLNDGTPDPYTIRRIGVDDNTSLANFIVAVSGLRDFLKSLLRIGGAERTGALPVPSSLPER